MPVAERLHPFGTTIFAEMTKLAIEHDAVNLSQGYPDFDGPEFVKDAAILAMREGRNQYARPLGEIPLNEAIADRWNSLTKQSVDPLRNVQVTSGCTEAIAATMIGLFNPGDEAILFEPYYDSYRPTLAMAGASAKFVPLRWPDFHFELDDLRNAITPGKTRAIIVNTPHNPTGKVYTRAELEQIAALCIEHGLMAITDEVYEDLVFDGEQHVRLATLPGMPERTLTLSSLGKTFSLTGWKIGWAIGPDELIRGMRASHQFLNFATATPLQHGAAAAIRGIDRYLPTFLREYTERRDYLCGALEEIGFSVRRPDGTYFILCDHTKFGFEDDVSFCKHLTTEIGVAAIPPTAFYEHKQHGRNLVRFAFCKKMETLKHAVERLQKLR